MQKKRLRGKYVDDLCKKEGRALPPGLCACYGGVVVGYFGRFSGVTSAVLRSA